MKNFDVFLTESKQQSINRGKEKSGEAKSAKQSKLPYEMTVSGYKVFSTIHAQARAKQRRDDLSSSDWKKLFRRVVDSLISEKTKNGSYLFYSKSFEQSVVVDVRGKVISVISVYPRNHNKSSDTQAQNGTKDFIVESYLELPNSEYELMECVEMMNLEDIQIQIVE